jgi:selenocysteine lyase/cysteine desulfurase
MYLDHTASSKNLSFIEDYIRDNIMPIYANSHSMQSATGKQTVFAREEARHTIKQCVNANENDALIFIGTGATSASNLLISKLRVRELTQQIR